MSNGVPPASPPAAIVCRGLTKSFGPVTAVEAVDLSLPVGQFLALLGPSGCGKTTVLRLIAGFDMPDAGTIEIAGQLVAGPGVMLPPERRHVGMVFQDYALFPHLDVARNIAFGVPSHPNRGQRIVEALRLVGLDGYQRRMPHELSGGQQQRVALARALAPSPAVVLLDEPFSNLDSALRVQVRAELRAILTAARATVIMVTHDQEEALSLADQVAVMHAGRILQVATPFEIYHRPATRSIASFVGEANFVPAMASGLTATCELGTVTLTAPANGPVDLLIRPEALSLTPAADGPATIIARQFYGHDQTVDLRLPSQRQLRVRLGPQCHLAIGTRVTVSTDLPATPFPSDTSS